MTNRFEGKTCKCGSQANNTRFSITGEENFWCDEHAPEEFWDWNN